MQTTSTHAGSQLDRVQSPWLPHAAGRGSHVAVDPASTDSFVSDTTPPLGPTRVTQISPAAHVDGPHVKVPGNAASMPVGSLGQPRHASAERERAKTSQVDWGMCSPETTTAADGRVVCHPHAMAERAVRRATWADLEAVPSTHSAELIRGSLDTMPRPRFRHRNAGSVLGAELNGPFQRGRSGGPGGWWILDEPGIALPDLDVEEIAPDVAGWKKERLPHPPESGSITIAPDWVCEVLSPTTRRHDLTVKRPLYAEAGVRWMWLVDVDARTVVASRNENGRWMELGVWGDDDTMRAEPFEAHEISLSDLWIEPRPSPG